MDHGKFHGSYSLTVCTVAEVASSKGPCTNYTPDSAHDLGVKLSPCLYSHSELPGLTADCHQPCCCSWFVCLGTNQQVLLTQACPMMLKHLPSNFAVWFASTVFHKVVHM